MCVSQVNKNIAPFVKKTEKNFVVVRHVWSSSHNMMGDAHHGLSS